MVKKGAMSKKGAPSKKGAVDKLTNMDDLDGNDEYSTESAKPTDDIDKLTKKTLNNEMLAMDKKLRKAQVCIVQKLIKNMNRISKKKAKDEENTTVEAKKMLILQDLLHLKKLNIREVTKFALTNTTSFAKVAGKVTGKEKAIMRVADHPIVKKALDSFRLEYPDWEVRVPSLFHLWDYDRNIRSRLPNNQKKRLAIEKNFQMSTIRRTPNSGGVGNSSGGRQFPKPSLEIDDVEVGNDEDADLSESDALGESGDEDGVFEQDFHYASNFITAAADDELSEQDEKTPATSADSFLEPEREVDDEVSGSEKDLSLFGDDSEHLRIVPRRKPTAVERHSNLKTPAKKTKIYGGKKTVASSSARGATSGKSSETLENISLSKDIEMIGSETSDEDEDIVAPTNIEKDSSDDIEDSENTPKITKPPVENQRAPLELHIELKAREKVGERLTLLAHGNVDKFLEPQFVPISSKLVGEGDTEIRLLDLKELAQGEILIKKPSKAKRKFKDTATSDHPKAIPNAHKFSSFFMSMDGQCFSDEEVDVEDGGKIHSTNGKKTSRRKSFSKSETTSDGYVDTIVDDYDDDDGDNEEENSCVPVGNFDRGSFPDDSEFDQPRPPKIHPSWEAKKQLRNTGVSLANQGRKINFNDDTADESDVNFLERRNSRPTPYEREKKSSGRIRGPTFEKQNAPKLHPSWEAKKMQRNTGLSSAQRVQKVYFDRETTEPTTDVPAVEQSKAPKLHPSWEAKRMQRNTGISVAHQGKKLRFDNDISEENDRVQSDAGDLARISAGGHQTQSAVGKMRSSVDGRGTEPVAKKPALSQLHPSWEAKKMQRNTGISLAQQGKKVYFDES